MSFFSKNKKLLLTLSLVIVVAGGVFIFGANKAHAFTFSWSDLPIPIIGHAIGIILWIIMWILSKLVALGAYLAEAVLGITTFTNVGLVKVGWEICRGLCNMGFALILLAMAFATVLRIESYGMKQLLWKLVVVALLINFSLVIGGIIIDFSQILTSYFIDAAKGNSGSLGGVIMDGFNLSKIYDTAGFDPISAILGPSVATLAEMFVSNILLIGAVFAFLAFSFFLIIRIVWLWLLLIVSPLAWISMIVPGASGGLWGKWWSLFIKWTFFAPIYAFFLYLGLLMIQNKTFSSEIIIGPDELANAQNKIFYSGFFDSIQILIQYIATMIILLGGLIAAQKFGVYGAQGVAKLGTGIVKGAGNYANYAERWAAKGAKKEGSGAWAKFRRGTSYLAPTVWKEAWKKRQEEKKREAMPVAIGARQDLLNKVFSREKTDFRERAIRARRQEERKNINTINAEEQFHAFIEARKKGNVAKMAAYLQAATEQNDQNEFMRNYNKSKGTNYTMNAEGWADFLEKEAKPTMGEQQTYRLGHDLTRIMETNGQIIGRMYSVDAKTGKYGMTALSQEDYEKTGKSFAGLTDEQTKKELAKLNSQSWSERSTEERTLIANTARANATVEWSKQDPQLKARTQGRFSLIKEGYDRDGKTVDYGLEGDWENKIKQVEATHAARWQAHTKKLMMMNHAEELERANKALYDAVVDSYANKTVGMNSAQLDQYFAEEAKDVANIDSKKRDNSINKVKESIAQSRTKQKQGEKQS